MEIQLPFSFNSTLLLFASLVFLLIKLRKSKSTKTHDNLPPSPPKLPVIGHLHHMMGGLPHHALGRLTERFGPVLHLQLGETSAVVISSQEAAKEVLKIHDPACADRPDSINGKIILYDQGGIVFSPYGEFWRQMRKICILEMLSAKNVRSFSSIRHDEVSCLIKSLQSSSGQTINLTEKLFAMTSSVVSRAAFGKVLKDKDTIVKLTKKVNSTVGGFVLADVFPSLKFLYDFSWSKVKALRMKRELDMFLDAVVQEHKLKQSGEFGGEDIVDVLLRMKENREIEFPITDDNIKAVTFDIFIAGTDTSATTLDWVMAELMRNPRVMAKVQSEVRRALKGKGIVESESLIHTLKYLKLVIKETVRMHPPIPLLLRSCREECKVGGYSIPRKAKVLVNVWSMGMNPKYWDEPESFRPERFENNSVDFLGNNFEYLPFGAGRRICPGLGFGLANVELPLALLLYHFDWNMPEGMTPADIEMTEATGIAVLRKKALCLVPTAYNASTED